MNEGVAITFGVIFVVVSIIGLVLIKEMRTHRAWRTLVEENDLDVIRGIVAGEMDHWRTMRPPKGMSAAVWSGVQGMELLTANSKYVHVSTSAEAEFRVVDGKQTQVATALDTALTAGVTLVEMIFYDIPDYRPDVARVDVFTTFRSEEGKAAAMPILSLSADRAEAISIDWNEPNAREIALNFDTHYELSAAGEPLPIELPPEDEALVALSEEPPEPTAESPADTPDRPAGVR